jgi:hypothetical protein
MKASFFCPSVPGQRKAGKENTDEEHTILIPDNFYPLAARRILGPTNSEKRRQIEMNATMIASGTKAVSPVVFSIQDIPLVKIRESKTNPRRFFDEASLAERGQHQTTRRPPTDSLAPASRGGSGHV